MGVRRASPVTARAHTLFRIRTGEMETQRMSAIPTEYPVTLTDGTVEYQVFDATSYVNAVFSQGHRQVVPAAKAKQK